MTKEETYYENRQRRMAILLIVAELWDKNPEQRFLQVMDNLMYSMKLRLMKDPFYVTDEEFVDFMKGDKPKDASI
jgi:uncharacterized protein (DUF1919 family)